MRVYALWKSMRDIATVGKDGEYRKRRLTHTYTTGYSYPLWNVKCVCTHTAAVYPIFMIVLWRQKASACVFATLFLEHTSNSIFLLSASALLCLLYHRNSSYTCMDFRCFFILFHTALHFCRCYAGTRAGDGNDYDNSDTKREHTVENNKRSNLIEVHKLGKHTHHHHYQ